MGWFPVKGKLGAAAAASPGSSRSSGNFVFRADQQKNPEALRPQGWLESVVAPVRPYGRTSWGIITTTPTAARKEFPADAWEKLPTGARANVCVETNIGGL
jgi:hypothetical protein